MNLKRDFLILTAIAPLLFAALCVAAFGINAGIHQSTVEWHVGTDEEMMDIRADAEGSFAQVVEESGCVYADGELPVAVVVDRGQGAGWEYLTSQRAVAHAFEQSVYDGVLKANEYTKAVDHGMRVGAYCK